MNIKNFFVSLIFVLLPVNIFAQNSIIVFFAETIDGISSKVIQKIESSDKFCLAVSFDEDKYIKQEIQDLIVTRKIEPTIKIIEPYFPLISSEINLSSSVVFNKIDSCKDILNGYKKDYRTKFEINKHGIYLKGAALNDDVLNMFYKNNILWTMAKSEDENKKGLFIKNEVALFIPYTNFTVSETKIKQWFSSLSGKKYIPVVLTSNHIKNEKFMLNLISFVNNDNNFDVELPVNAAFYGYNSKTAGDVLLELLSNVPRENILKLCLANKEVAEYNNGKKDDEVYTILCDELSNMYSYNVINGILNNNKNSSKIFDISYNNIFRMLNKKVPNINEFQEALVVENGSDLQDRGVCRFTKKNNSLIIYNDSSFFTSFSVSKTNENVYFSTDADLNGLDSIDIYIDMNGIAYTGSQKMLKPVNAFFIPEHSWEFAVRITKEKIYIYKCLANNVDLIETLPNESESADISIASTLLRGNPQNWSYQVVAIKGGEVVDFIGTKNKKSKMFKSGPLQISMYNYK